MAALDRVPRRRARWRARWWRRVARGSAWRLVAVAAMVMGAGEAMVQQAQVVARCRAWVNGTCHFAPLQPIQFTGLDLAKQTLCKVGWCGIHTVRGWVGG